jgi:hypothetical protein
LLHEEFEVVRIGKVLTGMVIMNKKTSMTGARKKMLEKYLRLRRRKVCVRP